tara:strand:+ start:321 stop:719 length:399 start_codon:yes stop_codon:yes gene_type:complete
MQHFVNALKKYAVFSGRATRSEYWYFVLFYSIFAFVISVVEGFVPVSSGSGKFMWLSVLYMLVMILPSFGLVFRRLHDTGRSGWWWLINLVPFVGVVVFLVFMCLDSAPGENQYGSSPKGVSATNPSQPNMS